MNSTPTLTEQPALSRADMYKGITSAYTVVNKVLWQQARYDLREFEACMRVLQYLRKRMFEHLEGK